MKKINSNLNAAMQNNREAMEIGLLVPKIGRGKRRHHFKMSKSNKKALHKFMKEFYSMAKSSGMAPQNIESFANYIEAESKHKNGIMFSYEEASFLKKIVATSLREMERMKFRWYQLFSKIGIAAGKMQYRAILEDLEL